LEKLPEPVWMNLAGDVVDQAAAVGEKVRTHHVRYPQYQVFVDEVGNNTTSRREIKRDPTNYGFFNTKSS
jgi:hypothetical protein